jgi:Spy/CpxP family protein refolding chaperone
MKYWLPKKSLIIAGCAASLLFFGLMSSEARGQDPDPQPEVQQPGGDPIERLNLSAEQREKIRQIGQENRDERVRIIRRLDKARLDLEEALDSDNPSEALIEQRIREVTEAQASQLRMRTLTELRIRSVLQPEQLRVWRDLRQAQRNLRRRLQDRRGDRPNATPNQGNGLIRRGGRSAFPNRRP